MNTRQLMQNPLVRVALLTFFCFLLGSTGWLSWLYHLTGLTTPASVDVLTMGVGYLMQAAGIGVYIFVVPRLTPALVRRSVAVSLATYTLCLLPATLVQDLTSTLSFGYLANIMCGYAQGHYLFCLSRFVDKEHRGIVFGSAYAASTLASWLLSLVASGALVRGVAGVVVCAILALCAALFLRLPLPNATDEDHRACPTPSNTSKASTSLIVLACTTVALMSLTKNAGFGFPANDIVDGLPVELSRLLYGAGLLVAGIVSDKNRQYGAFCCAGALVTPFLMLSLSGAQAPAVLMWALNYLLFGFFSVYRVLLLADIAADMAKHERAGLGQLFGRMGDALGTVLYVTLASQTLVLIAISSALFACSLALLFVLNQKAYVPQHEEQLSEQEFFERFAARHDLSAREREVLRLVLAEHTNSEIAGELFVSEATVKFHVRNLLKKTGCKNRREVMALYANVS